MNRMSAELDYASRLTTTRPRKGEPMRSFILATTVVVGVGLTILILREPFGASGRPSVIARANHTLTTVAAAIEQFERDSGRTPSVQEGIDALVNRPADNPKWSGPYLRGTPPKDPWDRPLLYQPQPAGGFRLSSAGPDGDFGTADDIAVEVPPIARPIGTSDDLERDLRRPARVDLPMTLESGPPQSAGPDN